MNRKTAEQSTDQLLLRNTWWIRDPANPVLPPGPPGSFDSGCCMNPWVLKIGDHWHLYYAGADDGGRRRICLATAPVHDPHSWQRHGPILDVGPEGTFDANWTVLPHVVQFTAEHWHLYYTANSGRGKGLSAFPGIGLATSCDGITWRKCANNPVLAPSRREGDPDAIGIAGGSVLQARLPDGTAEWRFYYTGCPTMGDDVFLDQQKTVCLAVSDDGIHWHKRGAVMRRDPERDYENIAVAGPVVQQNDDGGFRMWYSAIGTRFGFYTIAYAESDDGLTWRRGAHYGDNLQLAPIGEGWERQMCEYPSVAPDDERLRLFYCGNGYGRSGIGAALSAPLRATVGEGSCALRIVSEAAGDLWQYRVPEALLCDEGAFKSHKRPTPRWYGPDRNGRIWHEWQTNDQHLAAEQNDADFRHYGLTFIQGIAYRLQVIPSEVGLDLRFTITNISERPFHNIVANPCLSARSSRFHDINQSRTYILTASGLTALRDTDRGGGDPIRCIYPIVDLPMPQSIPESFWGQPSATLSQSRVILRTSNDDRFTIATAWQSAAYLMHNEDDHHCIHSAALVGDLLPGETKTVVGKIVLVTGTPQHALEKLASVLPAPVGS